VTLVPGESIALTIEKPAAGGRMIARADGQVVLVQGAIPGERVVARIERVAKRVAYAATASVESASPDRRVPFTDPLCGGCLYAHIAYSRQLDIKARIIADAFSRIARLEVPLGPVAPSPEDGYRMRARLHVRGDRVGFFREGTHDLCDARATRQLLPSTCDVLESIESQLRTSKAHGVGEIELSENVDASERVVHLAGAAGIDSCLLRDLETTDGLTDVGPAASVAETLHFESSAPIVVRRGVLSFFQGNRFLLQPLVAHVVDQVPRDAELVDLYAGSGLFAIAAATVRGARVTAVEGDRMAAADLRRNAAAYETVDAFHEPVELFLTRRRAPAIVVVDPPRTGLSREALDGLVAWRPPRLVYVSCDVATLARDSRRLVDAGYAIVRADAFDLFPNTPHVETVVVFDRG